MRPPQHLQVGPYRYRVTTDEDAIAHKSVEQQTTLLGHTDPNALVILLNLGKSAPGNERDTLLHECLHALFAQTGQATDMQDDEEQFVRRLTPALLDLLRRNPRLVAYLTEPDK